MYSLETHKQNTQQQNNETNSNAFDGIFPVAPPCHIRFAALPSSRDRSKPIKIARPSKPKPFTFGTIHNTYEPTKPDFFNRCIPSNTDSKKPVRDLPQRQQTESLFRSTYSEECTIFTIDV